MADELSFEEFRAIESRGRSKKRAREAKAAEGDGDPLVSPDEAFSGPKADKSRRKPSGAGTGTGSLLSRLGVFLEMHEMQAAVCILLLLDSFAAFYAASGVFADDSSVFFDIWHRGLNIVGHIGYLVDAIVVAWQVYFESEGASKAYKLLNIFRLWRLLRLFLSMLDIEREEHDQTRGALGRTQRELEEARDKLRLVEDDIEREKEARGAVEDMLQNYKEEVDTLNEALKIAAMDIAEVAEAEDDFFSSDEDDEAAGERFGDEGSSVGGAVGAERDSNKNKDELYRLAMSGTAASNQKSSTFVIRDDGTFEHK